MVHICPISLSLVRVSAKQIERARNVHRFGQQDIGTIPINIRFTFVNINLDKRLAKTNIATM